MKILITGFGPFDTFTSNPTEELVRLLSEEFSYMEHGILPVVYGEAGEELLKIIEKVSPDILVSFGLNGKISHIALEEIAINLMSSEIPDNRGNLPADRPISEKGPLAYRSLLPNGKIMKRLRGAGIPAISSYSAGAYICNEVFYTGLQWAYHNDKKAGFIHVPMATYMMASDPRSYRTPHMPMDMIFRAGKLTIETIME
ncbi:MAG: pyroglutamyl-peptidase I [Thermoplasmatota archaeon]